MSLCVFARIGSYFLVITNKQIINISRHKLEKACQSLRYLQGGRMLLDLNPRRLSSLAPHT